jgi:hypothetical protein
VFVNDSLVPLNSTTVWTNTTKTIYGSEGERIAWLYYVLDGNGVWTKSYTYSFVAGMIPSAVSFANYRLITDNSYDLLAYDGTNLANLGNFPQYVGTYGPDIGFHQISWNPQGTMAIAIGYNDSAVLFTKSTGSVKTLDTGASPDTNLEGITWMPNGTSAIIAGSGPDMVLVYSTTNGNFTRLADTTGVTGLRQAAWNPVFNYGIICGSNGLIRVSETGGLSVIPSASGISFATIAFNPNGTIALLGTSSGSIYKYDSTSMSLSLIMNISGNPQFRQIVFSRDGAYALIGIEAGGLYKFDGESVYQITSETNSSINGISFSPDDSSATATTYGGLLTENYDANVAVFSPLTKNEILQGIDFLPPAVTTVEENTSSTNSSIGSISVEVTGGPYFKGNPINLLGQTLNRNGSAVSNQTAYLWVNGEMVDQVASNASGYWATSFTPSNNGTDYVVMSQYANGGGVTSSEIPITVSAPPTTTSTTTTTKTTTTTNTTTTQSTTTSSSSTQTSTSTSTSSTNSSSPFTSTTSTSTTSTTISNSTTSYQEQSTTTSNAVNLVALFGTIPYVTTSSPTLLGSAIFACEVGVVVSIPFIVRKIRKKDQGDDQSRDWRW